MKITMLQASPYKTVAVLLPQPSLSRSNVAPSGGNSLALLLLFYYGSQMLFIDGHKRLSGSIYI